MKNPIARCICCLYQVGFGYRRISRHTRVKPKNVSDIIKIRLRSGVIVQPSARWAGNEKKVRPVKPPRPPKPLPVDPQIKAQQRAAKAQHKAELHEQQRQLKYEARLQRLNLRRLKKRLRNQVWKWFKFNLLTKIVPPLVGCSRPRFIQHITRQFTQEMTLQNYGTVWELDHLLPCSLFDLRNPQQRAACFHFKNFRPLNISANRRKSARFQLH